MNRDALYAALLIYLGAPVIVGIGMLIAAWWPL